MDQIGGSSGVSTDRSCLLSGCQQPRKPIVGHSARIFDYESSSAMSIGCRVWIRSVGPAGSLLTAPASFPVANSQENLLWVIAPGYSITNPLGPCRWAAEYGSTLPSNEATCIVAFDNENIPTVLWWEGEVKSSAERESKV